MPPFVQCETTRHGSRIYYFRRERGKRIRLPHLGTPGFNHAYQAALAGNAPVDVYKPRVASFAWLVQQYRGSLAYARFSPATRRQRDNIFEVLAKSVGHEPFTRFTTAGIAASLDKRKDTPAQARNILDALRGLFDWAKTNGHVTANPTDGIKRPVRLKASEGFKAWGEEQVAQYRARWPLGTRQRVWMEVLLNTGLRRGDAVRVGKQHVKDGVATIKTEKTGTLVSIPLNRDLLEVLSHGPTGDLAFICGANCKPLVKEAFGTMFREACNEAGCKGYSAHGLRKLAATRVAEAGASVAELEALFGWEGGAMASLYTKTANRKRLAPQAMERLENSRLPNPEYGSGLKAEKI